MQFNVRYYQAGQAQVTQQVMQADDAQSLRASLVNSQCVVLEITPITAQSNQQSFKQPASSFAKYKFKGMGNTKQRDYPLFCRELRTLLYAGMTVVEAVDTLANAAAHVPRAIAPQLLVSLSYGQALSQALEGLGDVPSVLLAAVRAGERTSDLAQALDDYLSYHDLMAQLRSKILSAAIYPVLVIVVGTAIVVFLMTVVMPNFAHMYESLRGTAAGLTSWVIAISRFVNQNRLAVYVFLFLILLVFAAWVWTGKAKQHVLALAWRIKPLRKELEHFQLAMLYQTLHVLIKGGYPLTQAVQIAGEASLNSTMQAALKKALLHIEQGKPIAHTLHSHGLCTEVDRRLMAAAERNGDFYRVAQVVSGLHRDHFTVFVERLTKLIEPILLLAVAIMVGTVVVMMYLPIFEFSTQVR